MHKTLCCCILQQLNPDKCLHCFRCSKSIVDGLNGNSKRQLTEAAGRKINPVHPSDLEPEEASDNVNRKLAPTVKVEDEALDMGDECRRILMLDGEKRVKT